MERNYGLEEKINAEEFYEETSTSSEVSSKYPLDAVLWAGSTPCCKEVVIAKSAEYGRMLFTDGELQSTEGDEAIYHEHLVHPAIMMYRSLYGDKPLRVCVLGAGEGATCRELLKWPSAVVKEIVWNDFDKYLVDLCRDYMGYCPGQTAEIFYPNQRVIQLNLDACKLLRDETLPLFDVVICDLPDPELDAGKRGGLYSPQFWKDMYTRMASNCVVATHCGPIAPASVDGMALASSVSDAMVEAGFIGPRLGKVAIPSYQSEWGFLFGTKDTPPSDIETGLLPPGCRILDSDALTSFFRIPAYYTRVE
jgi:spermidine synthase